MTGDRGERLGQAHFPNNRQELRPGLQADPALVVRSHVLSLTMQELDQAIELELADNPALERLDGETEELTEEQILKVVAPGELRCERDDREYSRSAAPDDEKADWLDFAVAETSIHDHLLAQLQSTLPQSEWRIASYLVQSLNERGYLDSTIEDIALALNTSMERVEDVLHLLHGCHPRGVGARSVAECLELQIEGADVEARLARIIVREHMDDLIARRTSRICRAHKVLPGVVEAAFELILELKPNPAEGFQPATCGHVGRQSFTVKPDLVLARTEQGWEITTNGADPTLLRVDPIYRKQFESLRKDPKADDALLSHVQDFTQRAERFIACLEDRHATLKRIGAYLVQNQVGFVSTGRYEFLSPMTRSTLAAALGVHESTMSRATMGKFVQIDTGDVVPFEVFFKPSLRIQKMIEEILLHENPGSPLSDEQITHLLAKRGVHVARRTVNKYRDKTRLLNSRARKSA